MDRNLWTKSLSEHRCPPWPCPVCRKGTIALVPKSLISHETTDSKRERDAENWDPDWIRYTFTAWGECNHSSCKQRFAIVGEGGVGPDYDSEGAVVWSDYFLPQFCRPMPDIINLPKDCPSDVLDELRSAFSIFWTSKAACAGRIRVALECLMNYLKVPKRKKDKSGKYSDLSLHARIDSFGKDDPTIGPQLMALKWFGNAGSHENDDVKASDLLDAFEILEHALIEIVDGRSARVAALAKELAKKHKR